MIHSDSLVEIATVKSVTVVIQVFCVQPQTIICSSQHGKPAANWASYSELQHEKNTVIASSKISPISISTIFFNLVGKCLN